MNAAQDEVAAFSASASIHTLPVWKKNATAAEWLNECAALALAYPEKFSRVVVVAEEYNAEKRPIKSRLYSWQHDHNTGILGTLTAAQLDLYEHMRWRT